MLCLVLNNSASTVCPSVPFPTIPVLTKTMFVPARVGPIQAQVLLHNWTYSELVRGIYVNLLPFCPSQCLTPSGIGLVFCTPTEYWALASSFTPDCELPICLTDHCAPMVSIWPSGTILQISLNCISSRAHIYFGYGFFNLYLFSMLAFI